MNFNNSLIIFALKYPHKILSTVKQKSKKKNFNLTCNLQDNNNYEEKGQFFNKDCLCFQQHNQDD